jgi:hypothetical protein
MKRVLILCWSSADLDRDPRVLRQISALRGDYELATCGFGERPAGVDHHFEISEGTKFRPVGALGLGALAVRAHKFAYGRNPSVALTRKLLAGFDFDLVLANDLQTVPVALGLAGDRPVVADLHEYDPAASSDWRWKLLVRSAMVDIARNYVPRCASVTTVAPGIADEYRNEFGFDSRIVMNAGPFQAPQVREVGSPIRLLHHGGAQRNREPERMIEGVGGLDGFQLDLVLTYLPDNRGYIEELQDFSARYSNVRILPAVPFTEVPAMVRRYDMGLHMIPPTNFNNLHSLPNKFFDFIQGGLPVVIGPSPEMAELTREYELGLVLEDWEPATLRSALSTVSLEQVKTWKRNSCQAAKYLCSEKGEETIREVVAEAFRTSP